MNEIAESSVCESLLKRALKDPLAIYLLASIRKTGCLVRGGNIKCLKRDAELSQVSGKFDPETGIIIYEDEILTRSQVEDTLRHELIHLFDYCRYKFDQAQPRHVACSEVRAIALSGECRWIREFMRGNVYFWGLKGHFIKCIKRRALLSLSNRNTFDSERTMDEVFNTCIADTSPFLDIP